MERPESTYFGSKESSDNFASGNKPEIWETLIGAGPNGETVKFEVSKESRELQDRLKAEFESRHAAGK